jgi:FAD/FMN-containing dehydrogenase
MNKIDLKGRIVQASDKDFDQIILSTLFNKQNPKHRPDLIVQPHTVADIIAVVKQANTTGKKLSVCSGGHSWSANHIRPNSILIDMSRFNEYQINKPQMTATAGPAVGGSTLLVELYKQQLFFPAGHCKGVCIGGYLLQGGFAWNGRKLGMACESVLGIDLVTAHGEYIHANETQNSDYYWAARGSGGGFFGIVVRFHLKLHPLPKYRGIMSHVFGIKHLEDVFNWAHEVGPTIPPAVEFQMLTSRKTLSIMGPGIEAAAPIFADTKAELNEAMAFMKNSPIKSKAYLSTPFLNPGIKMLYNFVMSHYPSNYHWGVDNMWTHAPVNDLMPYLKKIAATLPPAPAHMLWLNWYPPAKRQDMAFSTEDNIYIALYGCWKSEKDTALYGNWATNLMSEMAHLSTGIQLADENLHNRTAPFVSNNHLQKLDAIRLQQDPNGIFNTWHSRP